MKIDEDINFELIKKTVMEYDEGLLNRAELRSILMRALNLSFENGVIIAGVTNIGCTWCGGASSTVDCRNCNFVNVNTNED